MAPREALSGFGLHGKFAPESTTSDFSALSGVSRTRAWGLTALAVVALAITLVDRQVLAALASTVSSALSISDVSYGILGSGFATAYLLGTLPAARLIDQIGPRIGLVLTLGLTSLVIGLHALVTGFAMLLALRIALGLVVALSFPCATQTIYRVFPFKDRVRATGLLYFGNSLGSAACAPLAVVMDSAFGWRGAFLGAATIGVVWIPVWMAVAFTGGARTTLDEPAFHLPRQGSLRNTAGQKKRFSFFVLARDPGVLRGGLVVAAAAPVTTVMLLWGSKYLVHDHHLTQSAVGRYLWLPALLFGTGSVLFGELRARSASTRSKARPPLGLLIAAALLAALIATVPFAHGPGMCTVIASLAMAGAGGLYTLATSDMLAHAPRGTVPAMTGFTTLTQSVVYIVVNPLIGKTVQHFGNYDWVMIGAGLWILPGCLYWIFHASQGPLRTQEAS